MKRLLLAAASGCVRIVSGAASACVHVATLPTVTSTLRVLSISVGIALLGIAAGSSSLERVPPGNVGVLQKDLGGRGVVERDHPAGLYLGLPLGESWHLVDSRTQVLAFGWETEGGEYPALDLRTRDDNTVHLGASVVFRVKPGEAWQLVRDGLRSSYRLRLRAVAEEVLSEAVSGLTFEEIASTEPRRACAREVARGIAERVAAEHLEVLDVLLTQVWFGGEFEKKLQKRQLAAQLAALQEAATTVDAQRAAIELYEQQTETFARRVAAEWDERIEARAAAGRAEVAALRAATKAFDVRTRSAAEAERDELAFAGEQAIARAKARRDELFRAALDGGRGRIWLARRAAQNLDIRKVALDTTDPSVPKVLDLDGMVRFLVGAAPEATAAGRP